MKRAPTTRAIAVIGHVTVEDRYNNEPQQGVVAYLVFRTTVHSPRLENIPAIAYFRLPADDELRKESDAVDE